ncbi:hypothetical protein [Kluyvera sichuanensis]|uniref:hypothetical protein n=1 Tax=Kluyvera sichuanensis TaxID=2725494 RepID=UPI002FD1CA42
MDLEKALQAYAGTRSPALSEKDHERLTTFLTTLLQQLAAGKIKEEVAVESLMFVITGVDNRDLASVRNWLNLDNWPSTTGNPSGGGRSNAPSRDR